MRRAKVHPYFCAISLKKSLAKPVDFLNAKARNPAHLPVIARGT
jgi:hypothetical protein